MARVPAIKKASGKTAGETVDGPVAETKSKERKPSRRTAEAVVIMTTLPVAMTWRASPARSS